MPGVAESYEANADNTVYTFHLRDAKWSNGDPVKASDFVFSWQRAVDPKTASNYAYFLGLAGIKNADDIVAGKMAPTELGVKAIDDKTLEVTLNASIPYFVRMTAHATLFPIPQTVVEKFGADWTKPENIVGNGAYILTENSPGERVTVKRNPNYWDNAQDGDRDGELPHHQRREPGRDPLSRWRSRPDRRSGRPVPVDEVEIPHRGVSRCRSCAPTTSTST